MKKLTGMDDSLLLTKQVRDIPAKVSKCDGFLTEYSELHRRLLRKVLACSSAPRAACARARVSRIGVRKIVRILFLILLCQRQFLVKITRTGCIVIDSISLKS